MKYVAIVIVAVGFLAFLRMIPPRMYVSWETKQCVSVEDGTCENPPERYEVRWVK